MGIKDLKEETRMKISFPDEGEIEEDWQRIMYTTDHLMEYLLDLGLDPEEIYRTIMFMGLKRYFTECKDLESARQEAQIYLDATLDDEHTERKKYKRVRVSIQISFRLLLIQSYHQLNNESINHDFKIN